MPLKFHREIEQKHYNTETNDFIKTELAHAQRQVRAFREALGLNARAASPRDIEFADSADKYLFSLETAFGVAEGPIKHGRPNEFRDRFLAEFPEIIANFATAVYQRQEELPYRFFTTRAPESRFAPSELALEYAVTIRAAEAVSADYHDRLRRLYPPGTDCHPPLVALSGGPVAALRAHIDLCRGNPALSCPVPVTPAALIEVLRHCQNLSCIRLPRWSSQHIRTYALAAHEHMHRVQHSSTIITREAKAAFRKRREGQGRTETSIDAIWSSDKLSRETVREAMEEFVSDIEAYAGAVGNDLATLTVAAYELFHDLWRTYRRSARIEERPHGLQAVTYLGTVPIVSGIPVPHRGGNAAERDFEIWRSVAQFHARELLADIGAVLIAGPAFVLAFRTIHPIADPKEGVAPGNRSHPSTNLRIWLHIELLRRLGFEVVPDMLEQDLREEWGELNQTAELEHACDAFLAAIAGPDGTIDHLITHLTDATNEATYNLHRRRQRGTALSTEADLLDHWGSIAHNVEEQRRILSADVGSFAPPDTINAIWWKRIAEQSEDPQAEAQNRLAWRVALRNHGRLADGA